MLMMMMEGEAERQSVINERWLEDRLGLLTNHNLTLMQVGYIHWASNYGKYVL